MGRPVRHPRSCKTAASFGLPLGRLSSPRPHPEVRSGEAAEPRRMIQKAPEPLCCVLRGSAPRASHLSMRSVAVPGTGRLRRRLGLFLATGLIAAATRAPPRDEPAPKPPPRDALQSRRATTPHEPVTPLAAAGARAPAERDRDTVQR